MSRLRTDLQAEESISCCLQATGKVAVLAAGMQRLQAFIHISTCYVNAHRPPGSHIEEALYPLVRKSTGGTLQHAELAAKLAQMAPAKAEKAVSPESLVMHSSMGP